MHEDDRWSGEHHQQAKYVPTVRELNEIYRGPRWAGFDAFVGRMLRLGGMLAVWIIIAMVIVAVIKGDVR